MVITIKRSLTREQAESITQEIAKALADLVELVIFAYQGEAWRVLEYPSWAAYVKARFPSLPRFDSLERKSVVRELTDRGEMSTREIGAVLGVDQKTVVNDLREEFSSPRSSIPTPERGEEVEVQHREIADPDIQAQAIELAKQGMSYRKIGPKVGIDESSVRRDPMVRAASAEARPSVVSKTNYTNDAVCRVDNASALITQMERNVESLTGPRYTLSHKDIRRLRRMAERLLNNLDTLEGNDG